MKIKTIIENLGGPAKVAEICGITSQAVSQWTAIPVNHVLNIEKATGGKVTRHELRPDIYPPDNQAA